MFYFWQPAPARSGIMTHTFIWRRGLQLDRTKASTGADMSHDILGTLERRMETRFSDSRPWSFRLIFSRRAADWSESIP
jgi:hypothetical protein